MVGYLNKNELNVILKATKELTELIPEAHSIKRKRFFFDAFNRNVTNYLKSKMPKKAKIVGVVYKVRTNAGTRSYPNMVNELEVDYACINKVTDKSIHLLYNNGLWGKWVLKEKIIAYIYE